MFCKPAQIPIFAGAAYVDVPVRRLRNVLRNRSPDRRSSRFSLSFSVISLKGKGERDEQERRCYVANPSGALSHKSRYDHG